MKKIIINIFKWFIWKSFQKDMKKFIGYESIKQLNNDFIILEQEIKFKNNIPINMEIKFELIKKNELEEFAKYYTYKQYLEKWKRIECINLF